MSRNFSVALTANARALFAAFAVSAIISISAAAQTIPSDESSIYAIVIRDVRRLEGTWAGSRRELLVLSRTMQGDKNLVGEDRKSTRGLLDDYEYTNRQPLNLPKSLLKYCRCSLISETELNDLLGQGAKETERRAAAEKARGILMPADCDPGWMYFEKRFPSVNQYYKLSRIGYSANRKFAFVETEGIGACSNSSWTHLLRRTRHGWKIFQRGGGGRGIA